MNYLEAVKKYQLRNLSEELKGPVLFRPDINVPVKSDGRISRDMPNLRLKNYAEVIDVCSEFAPIVVYAHQGRKGEKDFVGLHDHAIVLAYLMKHAVLTYEPQVEGEPYFTDRLARKIQNMKKGEVLLLANVREFDFEENFNPDACPYIPFFKKAGIKTCVNDGIPLWHRPNSSVMTLPRIERTYSGIISYNELEIQYQIMYDDGTKAIVISGKKPKFEAIPKLAERMDVFTGGLTGQMICRLKGYDLGDKNNSYLEQLYKPKEIEILRQIVKRYNITTPKDFVVLSNGERAVKSIDELKGKDWVIRDIGPTTVDEYSRQLQHYDRRIRAGSMGVFEEGYNNGSKLVRAILGKGFVAVGGDTIEELQENNLCEAIRVTGGTVLLGGGAHLDGWAGEPYPSLDEIIKLQG